MLSQENKGKLFAHKPYITGFLDDVSSTIRFDLADTSTPGTVTLSGLKESEQFVFGFLVRAGQNHGIMVSLNDTKPFTFSFISVADFKQQEADKEKQKPVVEQPQPKAEEKPEQSKQPQHPQPKPQYKK